jgi:hypothetical protein
MLKDKQSSSLTPEIRERRRIMSRMTHVEKKAYKWKCYNEKAKPKLLELIEYCQSDNRIFPYNWGVIYNNFMFLYKCNSTKYSLPGKPLILSASSAPDIEKRQRLLTQIYWCYKNMFIDLIYDNIMKNPAEDWEFGIYQEDKISLESVKKEYASWLGVNYHPEHNIWNYCTNHDKNRKQIERAEEIYNNQEDVLDDESVTSIDSR